ncbi:MAG TPA: PIG-L family deacetylase [Anaerolineaceae bacterium]|jgi:LmbE family N-acetylglucosaminyl deacetylase|nr:PIG-L family deacetylase [Anaerolineaceae bacterium]
MQFHLDTADLYIPDGQPTNAALARTTHLAIAAHQDDIEIMAAAPILECFQRADRWFTGVVVTDGRGSPRAGLYAQYDNEEMRAVRFKEQRKAAYVGEYAAQVILDYPSSAVKSGNDDRPVDDLALLLRTCQPQVVYTHNLADKHDTHVGVALKAIAALRRLPLAERPLQVYGCEVWRGLDWMLDEEKMAFNLSDQENLQSALLGVFDSQISGGKRYDLSTLARRRANATYFASHGVDTATGLAFAMDLTPLIADPLLDPGKFIQDAIQRFQTDVAVRISRLLQ